MEEGIMDRLAMDAAQQVARGCRCLNMCRTNVLTQSWPDSKSLSTARHAWLHSTHSVLWSGIAFPLLCSCASGGGAAERACPHKRGHRAGRAAGPGGARQLGRCVADSRGWQHRRRCQHQALYRCRPAVAEDVPQVGLQTPACCCSPLLWSVMCP